MLDVYEELVQIVRMNLAISLIIDEFGGLRPFARALGKDAASTVQYWNDSGYLPRKAGDEVYRALREKVGTREARRLVDAAILGGKLKRRPRPTLERCGA